MKLQNISTITDFSYLKVGDHIVIVSWDAKLSTHIIKDIKMLEGEIILGKNKWINMNRYLSGESWAKRNMQIASLRFQMF